MQCLEYLVTGYIQWAINVFVPLRHSQTCKVMVQIWLLVNAKIQSNNRLLMPEVSIKKNSKMKNVCPNVLTKEWFRKDYLILG